MSAARKNAGGGKSPLRLVYSAYGRIREDERFGYGAVAARRRSGRPIPRGGSGDAHLLYDRELLVRISQEIDRDSALGHSLITRAVDFWLGAGFVLQPKTGNKRRDDQIKRDFAVWGEDPEARGLYDWGDLEYHAARAMAVCGDVGAHLPSDGDRFVFVESERIKNPRGRSSQATIPTKQRGKNDEPKTRMIDGVEVDAETGRPVRFHVGDFGDDPIGDTTPIPAEEFAFMAHAPRHSMTRGIPPLTPEFSMLERISDVLNSEAECWQVVSRLAFMIKRANAPAIAAATSEETDADRYTDDRLARRVHDVGNALVFHGEPGEDVEAIRRELPGADFPESVRAFCRLLGLVLGLPIELVMLDFSQGSYSSVRGALIAAYRTFTRFQKLIKRSWHTPIYRWWIERQIKRGQYPDTAQTRAHDWIVPRFPYLDPAKDAEAVGTQIDRGLMTYDDALAEQGRERSDITSRRRIEIEEAMQIAADINAKFAAQIEAGDVQPVTWQMFAGLSEIGAGGAAARAGSSPAAGPPDGQGPKAPPPTNANPEAQR